MEGYLTLADPPAEDDECTPRDGACPTPELRTKLWMAEQTRVRAGLYSIQAGETKIAFGDCAVLAAVNAWTGGADK